MSRLELGPEDNPNYVIDENQSGDLEVRDSGGSVIATYKQDGSTEVGTLSAEELQDASDGQAWETLKEAGYETGDVLQIASFGPASENNATTSSTDYDNESSLFNFKVNWGQVAPQSATTCVRLSGQFTAGTGEDYDVRVYNTSDSEELVSITSPDNPNRADSGWVEYSPPDTVGVSDYLFQHRTNPGTNSSTSYFPTFYIGVKI